MFYTFLSQASNKTIDNVDIMAGYPFREKWDVLENLKLAAEDEKEEAEVVYPAFRDKAKEEGFLEIAKLFDDIIKVEKGHKETFLELYEQMKNGTLYKKAKPVVWRCADCGYESSSKEAWDECPVCKAPKGAVVLHLKSTQQ
jgi:rubrerythrin